MRWHGFWAAAGWKLAGEVSVPWARLMESSLSSIGWRSTSSLGEWMAAMGWWRFASQPR